MYERIKYPANESEIYLKIVFFIICFYLFYKVFFEQYIDSKFPEVFVSLFFLIIIIFSSFDTIYKLYKYDEFVLDEEYLILMKNKEVVQKIFLNTLHVQERENKFRSIFSKNSFSFYEDSKLIFSYNEAEISEEDNKKLLVFLKKKVNSWEYL